MDSIGRNIQILLAVIKRSDEYQEYKKQEAILKKDPELLARVDQFRADNFRLQNEANHETLIQVTDQIYQESKELRKIPTVNAYLDAELALCRMMQRISRAVVEGIDMHIPDI